MESLEQEESFAAKAPLDFQKKYSLSHDPKFHIHVKQKVIGTLLCRCSPHHGWLLLFLSLALIYLLFIEVLWFNKWAGLILTETYRFHIEVTRKRGVWDIHWENSIRHRLDIRNGKIKFIFLLIRKTLILLKKTVSNFVFKVIKTFISSGKFFDWRNCRATPTCFLIFFPWIQAV